MTYTKGKRELVMWKKRGSHTDCGAEGRLGSQHLHPVGMGFRKHLVPALSISITAF